MACVSSFILAPGPTCAEDPIHLTKCFPKCLRGARDCVVYKQFRGDLKCPFVESHGVPGEVSGRSCEHEDIGKGLETQRRTSVMKQRCIFWKNTGRSKDFWERKQMDRTGSRSELPGLHHHHPGSSRAFWAPPGAKWEGQFFPCLYFSPSCDTCLQSRHP